MNWLHKDRGKSAVLHEADFTQTNFDANKYAREKFTSLPVNVVQEQYEQLLKEKKNASEALKANVYRNYPKFIGASKEIGNLEADMLELRKLLSEQNSAMKGLFQEYSSAAAVSPYSLEGTSRMAESAVAPKYQKDLQIIQDAPDDLDAAIAERRFEKAVARIESCRKVLEDPALESTIPAEIKDEIERRIQTLGNVLIADLQSPTVRSRESRKIITLLMRLGMPDKAREVYLDTRSIRIEREIKKLKLEGDISLYISDLARLVFSSINTTCDDFRASFTDQHMMSGFIVWAIGQIEKFGTIFRNQVFRTDDFSIMGKCLEIAKLHCTLLEGKGLSLLVVLNQMFYPNLVETINDAYRKIEVNMTKQIKTEQWNSTKQWIYHSDSNSQSTSIQITESAKYLYAASQSLANNIARIATMELVPIISSTFSDLFESYLLQLAEKISSQISDGQGLSILANSYNVIIDLVPRLTKQVEIKLNKSPIRDFEKLLRKLQSRHQSLQDLYCSGRAEQLVKTVIDWSENKYSMEKISETAPPSKGFLDLFAYLSKLKPLIASTINQRNVRQILTSLIEELALRFADDNFWESEHFTDAALQQLVLDLRYFSDAIGDYSTETTMNALNDCMDKAVLAYCKTTGKDINSVLKSDEWFAKRISSHVSKTKL
eukprot:TRINITY_DN9689_c0_g1_i2.p1 TRINITY_DN9689_c0_g1~~TRINITY_DN9689_c0_g1_i2.p1  ORF type:complete len:661 (+),score=152.21 TRINITY_DN9689_c0_g1_i2:95-2077(+)